LKAVLMLFVWFLPSEILQPEFFAGFSSAYDRILNWQLSFRKDLKIHFLE